MKISVVYESFLPASASPYRLRDEDGRELDWANAFLDAQRLRQLSLRSLRIYAYDLLHFARWFEPQQLPFAEINESTIVNYVEYQLNQDPKPTPQTVNHRLGVVRYGYRFHTGKDIPAGSSGHFQSSYRTRSPLGYGRRGRAVTMGLRLKEERRVVIPLTAEEVAGFWQSFHTYRDLALVGLMLLDGLRSCEVLELQLQDLQLAAGQIRVLSKGNKKRVVPLPAEIIEVLETYLRIERPLTNASALFVSLKGQQRGRRLTAARLRSLFRHHRLLSKVHQADPHRFRHTFGADCVRGNVAAGAATSDGTCTNQHHHALRPTGSAGRMA
jgi:site-specific recombinase XerD